jgi:hypothetical protein
MTSYKPQGRTLRRVILSLAHRFGNYYNFGFHEVLVAISRVELGTDIRILPPHSGSNKVFDYLAKLKPNPEIMQLLAGLRSGQWVPEHAWFEKEKLKPIRRTANN